ncbi:MAG TPA: hypothetical protein VH207_07280 [Chthoniobacterales bacterium]|jgi:hypothetical protein|nr:hypothetical protein [Chthoniobacterales bacterium]
MRTRLFSAALAALCLATLHSALAGSATWRLNPISSNWNRAINWTPETVPNGPLDVATFDVSNSTDVDTLESVEVSAMTSPPVPALSPS